MACHGARARLKTWRKSRFTMTCLYIVLQLISTGFLLITAAPIELNEPECGKPDVLQFIVNGKSAEKHQFPWMVHLELTVLNGSKHGCTGTIITKLHVLTAAHCLHVNGAEVTSIDVIYGHVDRIRGKRVKAAKKLAHPNYNVVSQVNDIAVIKVERPFPFGNNVRPVCVLLEPVDIANTEALVAGWGRLAEGGKKTHYLQYTSLRVLPHDACKGVYFNYNQDVNYCAYQKDRDTCQGDSGGPLKIKTTTGIYVQVGIISHGIGCAQEGVPGVYTRVDAFASWLTKAVTSDEGYADFPNASPRQNMLYQAHELPRLYRSE
ncbi:venom peptide isomerase heavy chain-like isoform X2 [Dermacentor variabilis]|uniref:venom peptide isomerase heavy chain-like isoform X2 n=2 Tax=Dermacentor variabilis TaxID=34621 RepID=UPI003F5BAAAE